MNPTLRALRTYSVEFALWLPGLIFITEHVASIETVRGRSMNPTLSDDRILVWRWRAIENLRRGQVVLYRSPMDPEKVVVKRVVGLEGDVIRTRKPCPERVVTVPEGQVWVEGDEAFHSVDSNNYGPISSALITARVTHVLFPLSRAGRLAEDFKGRRGALIHKASEYSAHD
ncbi:mitochondrial inner membrane peptidase complex catalytic subunit 2 [Morchella snyderi]|nr:mitochondrial inner membrane peptidase complex catalytic subunit 2 [Morchella snyderi]